MYTEFIIDVDGRVGELEITAPDGELGQCVRSTLSRWIFAAPLRRLEINYPITFHLR